MMSPDQILQLCPHDFPVWYQGVEQSLVLSPGTVLKIGRDGENNESCMHLDQ